MNLLLESMLKGSRNTYTRLFGNYEHPAIPIESNPNNVCEMLYTALSNPLPCMIARYGAFELTTIVNYLGVSACNHRILEFIKGKQPQWWWNKRTLQYMQSNAGFFPSTEENASRFSQMMLEDSKSVDLLGSWQNNEKLVYDYIKGANLFKLSLLEPYWYDNPWTRALKGKRVLVVHPFAQLIEKQYAKRKEIFPSRDILPDFLDFHVIKAVQSIEGNSEYKDWFEALDWMKSELDSKEYDIALLGCGAYGFPLAAHAKRTGHKAIHWGGSLQLYFGIMGSRWDNAHDLPSIINESWVRPSNSERPQNYDKVENGCYW